MDDGTTVVCLCREYTVADTVAVRVGYVLNWVE